jgi:hypothetical protein
MKKSIILLLLLVGYVIASGLSAEQKPIGLKTQSKKKILYLIDKHPNLTEALMPEEKKGIPESLSSIPIHVTNKAVYWIKKVIRSKWLPPEIEINLVALKDVKLWEKKTTVGIVLKRMGDFLVLEYELEGNIFHIQESGVSVSMRIDFVLPQDIIVDPKSFISSSLKEYLNLPSEVLDLSVTNYPPLFNAMDVTAIKHPRDWWHSVDVYTDGKFFFVNISEIENSDNTPYLGLPDRF